MDEKICPLTLNDRDEGNFRKILKALIQSNNS